MTTAKSAGKAKQVKPVKTSQPKEAGIGDAAKAPVGEQPASGIEQKKPVRKPKNDPVLTGEAAQAQARAALETIAQISDIGPFAGAQMQADRVANLYFTSQLPGYVGWHWVVTVARAPRARHATISETDLLPDQGALLAPAWVPWAQRIMPGDLGPGDVLPHIAEDARLEPGYQSVADDDEALVVWTLGLGRPRVLSPEGRDEAAMRWYQGAGGPANPESTRAPARCATCGFAVPLAGQMRCLFAVCANRYATRDGKVVSLDHGCGAHSETDVVRSSTAWPANSPMIDDGAVELVELRGQAALPAD
ncbi:MAG: DUF3027 domain-containing protein [Micrococcales bacterium]|nr:DUF3027 domain-containing protein [Micrococcales bacterium]